MWQGLIQLHIGRQGGVAAQPQFFPMEGEGPWPGLNPTPLVVGGGEESMAQSKPSPAVGGKKGT